MLVEIRLWCNSSGSVAFTSNDERYIYNLRTIPTPTRCLREFAKGCHVLIHMEPWSEPKKHTNDDDLIAKCFGRTVEILLSFRQLREDAGLGAASHRATFAVVPLLQIEMCVYVYVYIYIHRYHNIYIYTIKSSMMYYSDSAYTVCSFKKTWNQTAKKLQP